MNRTHIALGALVLALSTASIAFADDGHAQHPGIMLQGQPMQAVPATLATVTAVSGTTLTVTAKNGEVYTVDASNATVTRIPADSIIAADIAVGDTVLVQGSLSGSTIAATRIMDGIPATAAAVRTRLGAMAAHVATNTQMWKGTSTVPAQYIDEKRGIITAIGRVVSSFIDKRTDGEDRPVATVIGGAIADVGASSFSIDVPARGSSATSTASIVTDASTTYVFAGATSSFSDIAPGRFVTVQGIITATSTMTIEARRVEIATSTPNFIAPMERRDMGMTASSGPRVEFKSIVQTVLQKLGSIFHF